MNSKHQKTYDLIFAERLPKSLAFRSVEALLRSVGCDMVEGAGSRVAFHLRGHVVALHRPHPGKEIKPYQIKEIRTFLEKTEVKP